MQSMQDIIGMIHSLNGRYAKTEQNGRSWESEKVRHCRRKGIVHGGLSILDIDLHKEC
jgi:hypothetical protein